MTENPSKSNTPLILTGVLVVVFLALIFTRDQWGGDGMSGTIGKRKSIEKEQFKEGDVVLGESDARISRLMQNKIFNDLVTSGEFASLLKRTEFNNLVTDPRFQSLMADPAFAALISSPEFKALDVDDSFIDDSGSDASAENYGDALGLSTEDQIIQGGGGTGITSGSGDNGVANISQDSNQPKAAIASAIKNSGLSGGSASLITALLNMKEFKALYKYKKDNQPRGPGDPLQGVIISLFKSQEFRSLLMSPNYKAALSIADFKNILSAGEFHSLLASPEFKGRFKRNQ